MFGKSYNATETRKNKVTLQISYSKYINEYDEELENKIYNEIEAIYPDDNIDWDDKDELTTHFNKWNKKASEYDYNKTEYSDSLELEFENYESAWDYINEFYEKHKYKPNWYDIRWFTNPELIDYLSFDRYSNGKFDCSIYFRFEVEPVECEER